MAALSCPVSSWYARMTAVGGVAVTGLTRSMVRIRNAAPARIPDRRRNRKWFPGEKSRCFSHITIT